MKSTLNSSPNYAIAPSDPISPFSVRFRAQEHDHESSHHSLDHDDDDHDHEADRPGPQLASSTVAEPKFVNPTGSDEIDGLLERYKWANAEITFSFPDQFASDYGEAYPRYERHRESFGQVTNGLRSVVRQWLSDISKVSALTFEELDGQDGSLTEDEDAVLRIAMSNDPATAYAYAPWFTSEAGDIWFNRDTFGEWFDQAQQGEYAYHTIGHEISHALGLKHAHEGGGAADVAVPRNRDSMEFSIMTYRSYEDQVVTGTYANAYGNYAQSLMMLDIQAFQALYGANYDASVGDTLYTFSDATGEMFINGEGQGQPVLNTIFRTIWDGDGSQDTYDLSNYTTSLRIDLNPGGYIDLDTNGNRQRALLGQSEQIYARGHVFNSLLVNNDVRSLIENAIGGTGNDELRGNRAANRLDGSDGNDKILGGSGPDVLIDGAGQDVLIGGKGPDRFVLDADGDRDRIVDFAVGEDTLDLSAWGITDANQLQLTVRAESLELSFGQEVLTLRQVDADALDVTTIIGVPDVDIEDPGDGTDPPDPNPGEGSDNPDPDTPDPGTPDPDTPDPDTPDPEPPTINPPIEDPVVSSGRIQGQVRHDLDGDGDLADADAGLGGAKIQLFQDSNRDGLADGKAIATQKVKSDGFYSFSDLEYGSYLIVEINPKRYSSTGDVDGGNLDQILVTIDSNTPLIQQDFLDERVSSDKKKDKTKVKKDKTKVKKDKTKVNKDKTTLIEETVSDEQTKKPDERGSDEQTTVPEKIDPIGDFDLAERIVGRNGNDVLVGQGGDDDIFGKDGDDQLSGGAGNDNIRGEEGSDMLFGNTGDDLLQGTNKRDRGAGEQDTYQGGPGSDEFVLGGKYPYYVAAGRQDYALVSDFTPGEDKVVLHGSARQYRTTQEGGRTLLWFGAEGETASELVVYFANTSSLDLESSSVRYL